MSDPKMCTAPEDLNRLPWGEGVRVNALAVSPDCRFVVVGRENGNLERYDTDGLTNGAYLNPEDWGKSRAIESLAYSPDGQSLAVSNLKFSPKDFRNEFPRTECEIRIRSMPDGRVKAVVRETQDPARALAFSPKGRFLAIGGGESQEIAVKDLKPPHQEPNDPPTSDHAVFRGPGTVLWHVAFAIDKPAVNDKLVVAFARNRPFGEAEPAWEGFDLPQRRFVTINPGSPLRGAIKTIPGWTVNTSSIDRVRLVPAHGNPVVIPLNLGEDRRWSSYTFIPANPTAGHPKLTVAIGCEGGTVLIHSLPDGNRTRVLLGHSGGVYGLAPSPDGRWLASASADQTARLWRLVGCDQRPRLGATFQQNAQGQWVVEELEKRGFADQMGLAVGDLVKKMTRSDKRTELDISKVHNEIATMPLGSTTIMISVQRPAPAPGNPAAPAQANPAAPAQANLQTSLRNLPALNFLPGHDHEWIIWTPEGYYDTSIAGDHRLLGWHVNKFVVIQGLRVPQPSDFFPISKYRGQLHQPLLIDNLLAGGPNNAARPDIKLPPNIEIVAPVAAAPGAIVTVQQPRLNVQIRAEGGAPDRQIRSIVVYNGTRHDPPRPINPPAGKVELTQEVVLQPDENSITIEAEDHVGVKRTKTFLVRLDLPQPPPASVAPRLIIRSIGAENFADPKIHRIQHAERDARELARFLAEPGERRRFNPDQIQPFVLAGKATSKEIGHVFDDLAKEIRNSQLRSGDTLFLVIESHVLNLDKQGAFLLGTDAQAQQLNKVSVECKAISECLQEASALGCLVMVLLDGIHDELPMRARRDLDNWVRDLVDERGVMVLLASKAGPSMRRAQHGAFAQAVLDSITVAGWTGNSSGDATSPTLHDFQEAVIRGVERLTARRQYADFYPPEFLSSDLIARIRIFEPQTRSVENLAKK